MSDYGVVWSMRLTVEESHLDVWGHTNNVCYVQWMQDVAVAHSAAIGWHAQKYLDHKSIWVVRNHTIDYKRSTYLGNEILVQTWIEEMKSFSCLRRYRFLEIPSGLSEDEKDRFCGFSKTLEAPFSKSSLLVSAATTWAFISIETLRPTKIHPELISLFKDLCPASN